MPRKIAVPDLRVGDAVRLTLRGPCVVESIDPPADGIGEYEIRFGPLTGGSAQVTQRLDWRRDLDALTANAPW